MCVVLASISLPGAVTYRFCEDRVGALQWVFLFTCVDQATVARHTKPSLYTTATVTVPADATLARARRRRNDAPRNGFDVTDAVFNVRSSIRRLSEYHMIPAEVCDGQLPVRSTLYGRDIEINNAPGGAGGQKRSV